MADEDLIQDGYERAIQLIESYDPTLTEVKFLGYMKRMIMCYYWGTKRTQLRNPIRLISTEQVKEESYTESGYQKVELIDLLNILTPREKEIIIKVYLQGYRQKTVANDLGLSLDYIKETLYKSRKKMRKVVNI